MINEPITQQEAPFGQSLKAYAPRIFVSSTTLDLGSYRQLVCDELWKGQCFPIVQQHFKSDPRKLSEFLEDEIRKCDVVICLLGPRFGEAPEPLGGNLRSYTQLEYDTARQLNKAIYVFMASPSCILDDVSTEAEEKSRLQQEHITMVQKRDQSICKVFSGPEELRAFIIRLLPALAMEKQPKYWVQSPPPYPYFAGRETELQQLTRAVTGNSLPVVAVLGIAGQGKTTLTWEWFINYCPDVFAGSFWCPAEENEYTFDMFIDKALTYLSRGKYNKTSTPGINPRIGMLFQYLRDRPCLIIVDGMEKWLQAWARRGQTEGEMVGAEGRGGAQEGLDLFLSQLCAVTGGSHFLFTSRVLPSALDSAPHAEIPVLEELANARLQGLDASAAISLLRKLGVAGSDELLRSVANDFERHPLSLTILGKVAVRKYAGNLEHFNQNKALFREDKKLHILLDEMKSALPNKENSNNLMDFLSHFIETPAYNHFAAFMHWLVLAKDHAGLIKYPVMHLDDDALREGIATLDDWSLAMWDRQADSIHLHPLLREHFKSISTCSDKIHAALADWYMQIPIAEDAHSLGDMKTRILAVEHAVLAKKPSQGDRALVLPVAQCSSLSEWMSLWGHQYTGIDVLTKIIDLATEPDRSKHLISRGAMYQGLGKLSQARDDLSEAVLWLSSKLMRRYEHREILAGAYMNRGNTLASSGLPDQAVEDFGNALKTLAMPFGLTQHDTIQKADILTSRGSAYRDLGHLMKAEKDATRALQIYRYTYSQEPDHKSQISERIVTALINRGNARANRRLYDSADKDYKEALNILSQFPDTMNSHQMSLVALVRAMRGLLLNDKGDPKNALLEHNSAITLLSELVRQGRLDLRTKLGAAYANRVEANLALGEFNHAKEDRYSAKRLYDQAEWEENSRLAIWVTANQTTGELLSLIFGNDVSIYKRNPDAWKNWRELCKTQGKHVLAPFVRANTGLARLILQYEPALSADTVVKVLDIIENGINDGYCSEWLAFEIIDLQEFVAEHDIQMSSLGVPVEKIQALGSSFRDRLRHRGGGK